MPQVIVPTAVRWIQLRRVEKAGLRVGERLHCEQEFAHFAERRGSLVRRRLRGGETREVGSLIAKLLLHRRRHPGEVWQRHIA